MSSKNKPTDTKKEARSGLMPKLRFPEFREEVGWEKRQLSEITTAIFDGTHQTPTYTAEGVPFYSVENLVSGNANKFISRTDYEIATKKNKPEKGDVLITRIGKIGYSQVVTWSHDFSIYVTLAVIKKDGRFDSQFLHQFIQSALYQKEILSKSLLSAVPCKINMDSLRATHVLLASPAEQQKIAACLSSVDELMAAQARKVDALKIHKKGLMQQLFPREGKTQPYFRFPEFQNAGGWAKMTLGQAATFYNGRAYKQEELLESGKYPVLRVGNFFTSTTWYHSDLELDETKYCENGDLLYAWSASFGPRIWRGEKSIYHYHIWKVMEQRGIDKQFLFITLENETENMKAKTTNGLGIMHITKGAIESWECTFPTMAEQRKIAGCLTSLDDTITAESKKLDALKTHKEGLMQRLFPSPDSI